MRNSRILLGDLKSQCVKIEIDGIEAAWKKYSSKNPGAEMDKYFTKYDTLAINRKVGDITEETFQELLLFDLRLTIKMKNEGRGNYQEIN